MAPRVLLLIVLAASALGTGCRSADTSTPAAPLPGTSWRAQEIDGRTVPSSPESTLTFDNAQRISGHTACNRYFGGVELGEGTIRLKPAGATRMACPPAVMDQETRFWAALSAATAYRVETGTLLLLDERGAVRVRLVRLAR